MLRASWFYSVMTGRRIANTTIKVTAERRKKAYTTNKASLFMITQAAPSKSRRRVGGRRRKKRMHRHNLLQSIAEYESRNQRLSSCLVAGSEQNVLLLYPPPSWHRHLPMRSRTKIPVLVAPIQQSWAAMMVQVETRTIGVKETSVTRTIGVKETSVW